MSNNKYKILIIEDESKIRSFISVILKANGYKPLACRTGTEAGLIFSSHKPDLCILDLGLPDMDGTELIKKIRAVSNTPILVLSARTAETDKVEALDLGANDYITKPFGTAELLARVRAALRTSCIAEPGAPPGKSFHVADLSIDYDSRRVTVAGQDIRLTQTEYNIVAFLSSMPERYLPTAPSSGQSGDQVTTAASKSFRSTWRISAKNSVPLPATTVISQTSLASATGCTMKIPKGDYRYATF